MNEKMKEAIEALVNHGVKVEIKTHCIFCGKEEMVPYEEATDYICNDCRELLQREFFEYNVEYEPTFNPEDGSM